MLIESMRDIGYSLETALADVIDNSITAAATRIDIRAHSGEHPRIAIIDDGCGMSWEQLMAAMRPGSRNPLDERTPADLGRFGLGLKTASFSQCRRLTVVTRRDGMTHAAVWDLQHVAKEDDWLVQIPDDVSSIPWVDCLAETGTLVLWEDLDRLVEEHDGVPSLEHFVSRIDDTRSHLELVFHRFLSGEPGLRKTEIQLNNRPLEARDPFHSRHPATVIGPLETIRVGDHTVQIQTHTLPHHRKVTPEEWERLAGREGYLKNQGFYVYRERRLIIYGTWFGLARQAELTKLARVRIDMPNGLDAEWKIDVKKASAQPPFLVRERLRRIIETIGATSKRVYTARGQRRVTDNRLPVWIRLQDKNQISYQINREHPVVAEYLSRLDNGLLSEFTRVIELSESTLPMDMFFADMGSAPDLIAENTTSDETLRHTVFTTVAKFRDTGMKSEELIDIMQYAEPFKSNWERTRVLLEDLDAGGASGAQ
jgi:Histidine kinase-, DNA gyrase B-, and HSP90-like ATPase